jgi:hypothetical protein
LLLKLLDSKEIGVNSCGHLVHSIFH